MQFLKIFCPALLLLITSCHPGPSRESAENRALPVVNTFGEAKGGLSDYWYQGEAEITRYELQQNRYGDIHPGEAIMIFVTEDFLTDKQVKNERYQNTNSVPILKNNMIRQFPTGIYDYSLMTSVFTPVAAREHPATLKVSTSSQEWCGHTYMQVNRSEAGYDVSLHSYFENEADRTASRPYAILEDELFNRIRINPDGLPAGRLEIFPGTMYLRLAHRPFEAVEATTRLQDYQGDLFEGQDLRAYRIEYPGLERRLEIVFEGASPYRIVGWTESYPSLRDKQVRTTIAKSTHTINSAYWQQNSLDDMGLRSLLGRDTTVRTTGRY